MPYDNESGLTVLPGGWSDWSDVRERVGTALMLQESRKRGWGDPVELTEALTAYERFVADYAVADDGTVRGDNGRSLEPRLYNFPWFARFLLDQGDIDRAVLIMDRYYALGGDDFLAFELGAIMFDLQQRLTDLGRGEDAARLAQRLIESRADLLGPR